MFVLRAASATACTAVNGGATTISTSPMSFTALRSSFTKRTASCTVLNIFQLPAMNGILIGLVSHVGRVSRVGRNGSGTTRLTRLTRPTRLTCRTSWFVRQRGHARQRTAAEELERGAAASGDVRDPVGDAGFLHCGD